MGSTDEAAPEVIAPPEPAAPEAPEPKDDPAARLLEQFEDFKGTVTSRFDRLEAEEEPEPVAPEPPAFDMSQFSDEDFDDEGLLKPAAQMRALDARMRKIAEETARAEVTPDRERRDDERRMTEADQLEAKYPELGDDKVVDRLLQEVFAFTSSIAPPDVAEKMAREPALLERFYLASKARERAEGEIPAGSGNSVTLETGGSAPPAAASASEDDGGDAIVALARSKHHRVGAG